MAAPPKGHLAAIKAILSLLLDGPETQENIKKRLRREHPHAGWNRSIVNVSLPPLVAQGLIVLIGAGKRREDDLYEITEAGIADCRQSARDASLSVGPLREPLELWIEHSTPDEQPQIIAHIRKLELEVNSELSAAQARLNRERQLGRCGPRNGSDYQGRAHYAVLMSRVTYWRQREALYKQLRADLRGDHDLHHRRPAHNENG